MSDRIIRLGPGECPDIVTSARYFAALAFPGVREAERCRDAADAWAASYLHKANRVDRRTEPFLDERLNDYVRLDPGWCREKLKKTQDRLMKRAQLARALRPWIREALGASPKPVRGIKKFTQRQIALFLNNNNPEHADNFQKRIWRPGRPVIHLITACDLELYHRGADQEDFPINLADIHLIKQVVELSQKILPVICQDPRFAVNERDLLKLDWVS